MLFAFRGIRGFQLLLALIALACGVAAVVLVKAVADGASVLLVVVAVLLGLVFLWAFATALRAPTSFLAVDLNRGLTRVRFAGFVDTVIDNRDIRGVRVCRRSLLAGIGVRTNFSGDVALVSAPGEAAELTLARPVRVWLVPRLVPLHAQRLTLSIRHPEKLADRFGPAPAASPRPATVRKMKHRGPRPR